MTRWFRTFTALTLLAACGQPAPPGAPPGSPAATATPVAQSPAAAASPGPSLADRVDESMESAPFLEYVDDDTVRFPLEGWQLTVPAGWSATDRDVSVFLESPDHHVSVSFLRPPPSLQAPDAETIASFVEEALQDVKPDAEVRKGERGGLRWVTATGTGKVEEGPRAGEAVLWRADRVEGPRKYANSIDVLSYAPRAGWDANQAGIASLESSFAPLEAGAQVVDGGLRFPGAGLQARIPPGWTTSDDNGNVHLASPDGAMAALFVFPNQWQMEDLDLVVGHVLDFPKLEPEVTSAVAGMRWVTRIGTGELGGTPVSFRLDVAHAEDLLGVLFVGEPGAVEKAGATIEEFRKGFTPLPGRMGPTTVPERAVKGAAP